MPNIFCTWSIARAYCAPALVLYIFRKSASWVPESGSKIFYFGLIGFVCCTAVLTGGSFKITHQNDP